MLNLKQAIREDIGKGVKAAFKKEVLPVVKQADDPEHGDYASPVALQLAKQLKKKPLEIVEAIAKGMPKKEYIGRVTAAEPGFLNVFINPGWLTARLDNVIQEDIGAEFTIGKGKSINLEFISANPTGPMHLGNARTAFAADTLARVFSCVGYNVIREFYINDAGRQVERLGESVMRRILQSQQEKIDFPEGLYQGEYTKDIAKQIAEWYRENENKVFAASDLENKDLMGKIAREAVHISQAANEKSVKEVLQIDFDVWASEAKLRDEGKVKEMVDTLRQTDYVYTKDSATWLKTTAFGDDADRVLVKKDGEYAYIAADIAYFKTKYDRGFDKIFTFLGADHIGHVPSLQAAMKILQYDVEKLEFLVSAWMRFRQGQEAVKLSKRAGNIVTPKDLIAEVGYDVARFFMLQHDLKSHLVFDLDLAKEKSEKNPVYYVQYAYVRLQSILRRAKEEGVMKDIGEVMELTSSGELTHTAEIALMKQMYRLPEVLTDIAENFAVHQLTYYAHELASAIHFFYKHVPVLATEDEGLKRHRLQLVLAARAVLGKTLDLLGISKPDVM